LIRQLEPEFLKLVVQGVSQQVRVLDQSRGDVVDERLEPIRTRPGPYPSPAVTGQVLADRLAVEPGVHRRSP
jgi:hypothetical protein